MQNSSCHKSVKYKCQFWSQIYMSHVRACVRAWKGAMDLFLFCYEMHHTPPWLRDHLLQSPCCGNAGGAPWLRDHSSCQPLTPHTNKMGTVFINVYCDYMYLPFASLHCYCWWQKGSLGLRQSNSQVGCHEVWAPLMLCLDSSNHTSIGWFPKTPEFVLIYPCSKRCPYVLQMQSTLCYIGSVV